MEKVKFRKASRKDNGLTTVNLRDLDKVADVIDSEGAFGKFVDLEKDDEFIITVQGVRTIFFVNRGGRTAATYAFPRNLKLPSMNRPVYAEVDNVGEWV